MTNLPIKSINYWLLKQVNSEVDSRLNTSLYKQVFIVLDKKKNPGQIEKFGEMIYKVGSEFKSRLQHKDITTVFDQTDVNGRLLILGEPGSGKTTILLKLASELVKRAQDDQNHPIPVIFSLSSWKKDNQSIKDWLVDQLKDKYGVRKDIGKKLIDNQEIIPLLDGLDEIAAERQELCVRKINDFIHSGTWSNPLVVCSRTEEYQHYTTLLQLNNSLELCPFTSQQVYQYLNSTGNRKLWDTISYDSHLSQLATIPLLLNIIVLSIEEISVETWQQYPDNKRLSYLLEAYISKMLRESYKYNGKRPRHQQTRNWLGWLAHQLVEENETEFFIEKMQPKFLENHFQEELFRLTIGLIIGILVFLIVQKYYFLTGDIFAIFSSTIAAGIVGFFISRNTLIHTVETTFWSWKQVLANAIAAPFFGLSAGLTPGAEISTKRIPNQGIWDSLANARKWLLIFVLIDMLFFRSFVLFYVGLLMGLRLGGIACIQHLVLRLILCFNGDIPWNYTHFLDYTVGRLLLQRVGGGYRFIHILLQEHFAQTQFDQKRFN